MKIHNRIEKARTLILKHLDSTFYLKKDVKNCFSRIIPLLKSNDSLFLKSILNFEKQNLNREELRELQKNIAAQSSPFKHEIINKKQENTLYDFFNFSYEIKKEAQKRTSNIQKFRESDFSALDEMLDLNKKKELSFLRRNISQEKRIRKAFAIIFKYLPREISREISLLDKAKEK